MQNSQISAVRLGDFIDVYVTQKDGNLKHYWADNFTGWVYQNEILWNSAYGKPAVIRYEDNIDIYVLTNSRSLVHLSSGEDTNWKYNIEVLIEGISEPPVAVRWENDIDVYCFDNDGVLLHLHASPSTNWQYEREEIYHSSNHTSLFALPTKREAIDLYFLESGHIIHLYAGDDTGWVYTNERILEDTNIPNGNLSATRTDNCINLFYCNETGHVYHAICSEFTGWSYQNRGPISISTTARNKEFSVVQYENYVDVYFIANDNCIHHNYYGVHTNFNWNSDEIISLSDAISGIAAVRPNKKAIDVYYLGQNEQLKHLFIGEETNNDWSTYQTDLSNPILHWENLRNFATTIGEGHHGKVYLIQNDFDKFVVKKLKYPYPPAIRSEITILNKLTPIWPNLCQAQIFENGNLAGFTLLYVEGKKLDEILQDKENIFYKSASARFKLIKLIGNYMSQIQKLGICHGDFSLDNIMVNQNNKNSKNDFTVMILDFGNSFFFNSNTRTQASLTGWQCLKPPESKFGNPYDPIGVNAYQFSRIAIQILLLTPYSSYKNIHSDPSHELKRLKKFAFRKSLINFLAKGVHFDIHKRNAILNEIDSTDHLDSFDDHYVNRNIEVSIRKKNQLNIKHKGVVEDSKLPKSLRNKIDFKKVFEVVYDFLRKNPRAKWKAVEDKNYILLYVSARILIEDDIFITVSAEAKVVLFKTISDTGNNIATVDFEILKAQIDAKIGSYNGFELYAASVEGKVSVFDIKIGVGIRISQDNDETKVFGTGFFDGRRIRISVFDSEFGIDFKCFFSDEQ